MRNVLILLTSALILHLSLSQSCDIKEIFVIRRICEVNRQPAKDGDDPVFILYSVNPVEGFNLRRDVYIRMAIFLKNLRLVKGYSNAQLVLPTFHHLYHWKSHFRQTNMFWNHFFDLDSLKLYSSVIDMWEFFDVLLKITGRPFLEIDEVYKLQHFETMFESGVFIDKFEETACSRNEYDNYHYLEYYNISEKTITCLNFQVRMNFPSN
jgi:peptide-O-fucosyltransferase